MNWRYICFSLLVFWQLVAATAYAFAQESPQARALSDRVWAEVKSGVQCSMANYDLSDKLVAAQAEIKRLTEKYEPKPKE